MNYAETPMLFYCLLSSHMQLNCLMEIKDLLTLSSLWFCQLQHLICFEAMHCLIQLCKGMFFYCILSFFAYALIADIPSIFCILNIVAENFLNIFKLVFFVAMCLMQTHTKV